MSKFFLENEVARITFDDSEWVDVKEELTQEDQDFILNKLAHAEAKGTDSKVEMTLGRMALLQRAIVAWSFQEDGKSIPITTDNISKLRNRYRSIVLAKIDELNTAATEFKKKPKKASI